MALNIKSRETDLLARELAQATGETLTEAVTKALSERLERVRQARSPRHQALRAIRLRVSQLPVLDPRTDDELLGYDERGTFE